MYYVRDIESFGTGLKRIADACESAEVKVEFEMRKLGFAVVFYRPDNGSDIYSNLDAGDNVGDTTTDTTTDTTSDTTTDTTTDTTADTTANNSPTDRIISYCAVPRSREEIQLFIGYKNKNHFLKQYLHPLVESGKLKPTVPDKPNSKNQKYVRVQKNG